MYAVISRWTTDRSRAEAQAQQLREGIVPMVAAHPGFVAGYWTRDPDSGRTHSTVVLETEESARTLKALIEADRQHAAAAGVINDFLVIADVIAARQARPEGEAQ